MPTYMITSPSGERYKVTGPEGASQKDLIRFAMQSLAKNRPKDYEQVKPVPVTKGMGAAELGLAGAGKAFSDLGRGVEQLVREAVPGVSGAESALQSEINESRKLDAPLMDTGAGLAGNIGGHVAAFAPTAMIPGANTYTGAALTGAILGNIRPVAEGESRGMNTAAGLIGGAGGRAVTGGLGRMLSPQTSPKAMALKQEGIPMTPGALLGGIWKRTEDKMASIPILGDSIRAAQTRSLDAFNRASLNKVLAPIKSKVSRIGREGVEEAYNKVSNAYDDVLSQVTARADDSFTTEARTLNSMADRLKPGHREQFQRVLKEDVISKFSPNGSMPGDVFKRIDSELGRMARGLRGSQEFDNRELGNAFLTLQRSLRDMVRRSNPAQAPKLRAADQAYSRLLKVEDAAARTGAQEGVFTPAQLKAAVRRLDPSLRKRKFAHGGVDMQDFAESAHATLPSKYPDSGTAGRMMLGGLAAASPAAGVPPEILMGLISGAGMYTRPGVAAMSGLLSARPGVSRSAGNALLERAGLGGIAGSGLLTSSQNK